MTLEDFDALLVSQPACCSEVSEPKSELQKMLGKRTTESQGLRFGRIVRNCQAIDVDVLSELGPSL